MKVFHALLFAAAMGFATPFAAANIPEAQAHLDAGEYAQAISTASSDGTAQGYILAAEALCAQVMLELVPDVNGSAQEARALAQKALDIDPDNTEALIQYALALGFETRSSGIMKAYFGKLPDKSKAAIDVAYVAAPEDARTAALQGAWHLGIVRKTGEKRGRKMFGASETDGVKWYDNAVARAPSDIVILGNYAITLLSLDPVKYRDKSETLLHAIEASPARNATETEVKRRMALFTPLLDDPAAMTTAVAAQMNDPEE